MWDNTKMLGYYSVVSGMEIHCVDSDPFSLSKNGGLTDTSLVQKYKLSDENYDQRKGTMREFFRKQKALNPSLKTNAASDAQESVEVPGSDSVAGMKIGDRCEVAPGRRRGTVKFLGTRSQSLL